MRHEGGQPIAPEPSLKQPSLKQPSNTAQGQRVHTPEQIRRIEAKQKRQQSDAELARELYVGSGPVCNIPDLKAQIADLARRKSL